MAIKIMIVALLAAFAGMFFIEGPSGRPFLTLEDFRPSIIDDVQEATKEPTKVYKWKDEKGVWQFSTEPVDVEGVETLELDGNINIVEAFKAPPTAAGTRDAVPFSADKLLQASGNIEALEESMKERQAQLDKVTPNP